RPKSAGASKPRSAGLFSRPSPRLGDAPGGPSTVPNTDQGDQWKSPSLQAPRSTTERSRTPPGSAPTRAQPTQTSSQRPQADSATRRGTGPTLPPPGTRTTSQTSSTTSISACSSTPPPLSS